MDNNKIIGRKDSFALEIELVTDMPDTLWTLGYIRVWLAHREVGNFDQVCALEIPYAHFERSLEYLGQRTDPTLWGKTKEEVLSIIDDALFAPSSAGGQDRQDEDARFNKFMVFTNWGESFDGYLAVLVEGREGDRLVYQELWRSLMPTYEARLQPGEYACVVQEFLSWFRQVKQESPVKPR